MQVVVTRPEREAKAWVQALSDAGHEVLALPLIAFESLSPPTLQPLETYHALMFVSAQAVVAFFEKKEALPLHYQAPEAHFFDNTYLPATRTRYWAPGPGTARALLQVGIAADDIDQPDPQGQQFDSEALWQVVGSQVHAKARVLIVRGESDGQAIAVHPTPTRQGHGRDWLAQQCEAAGAQVDYAVVYKRVCPIWTLEQQHQAQQATERALWLFSNAEALGHLTHLLPQTDWQHTAALATHPRVARAVQSIGFANVTVCRPHVADVLTAVGYIGEGRSNGS